MKEAPKVFCPSCGVVWHVAADPKPDRKTKVPVAPKPVAKPKAKAKPVAKSKPAVKKAAAKKPAAKKKGSR